MFDGVEGFDWKHPVYGPIFERRLEALARIRREPDKLPLVKAHYRANPAQFISDWGVTYDPRNVEVNLPTVVPFVLFPRQVAWIEWVVDHWRRQLPGITDKSRELGLTWLSISLACTLSLHYHGLSVGFGSRKVEYVDLMGDPKCIFEKGRIFMENLPPEFRGGWSRSAGSRHMRLSFPETQSYIGGEGGDDIGRGDRRSIYFVDEAAHLENPEQVDAALSMTTNCRMDVSSVNGLANSFAQRRHSGKVDVFTFHWRSDPRKDDAWYAKKCDEIGNPVIIAQEIDIDYAASAENVLIPSGWVQSAIDARDKLGRSPAYVRVDLEPTGRKVAALDVADEGEDKNAICIAKGFEIANLEEWTGKGSDIFVTVQKAVGLCDEKGIRRLRYDGDGLGSGVRGDARIIMEDRKGNPALLPIAVEPWRASGKVVSPDAEDVKGRKNKDFFKNANSQAWWGLRQRFLKTHRAVTEGLFVDPADIISIPKHLVDKHPKLTMELSQPRYKLDNAGHVVVEKTPAGTKSPNLADAIKICFSARDASYEINDEVMAWSRRAG